LNKSNSQSDLDQFNKIYFIINEIESSVLKIEWDKPYLNVSQPPYDYLEIMVNLKNSIFGINNNDSNNNCLNYSKTTNITSFDLTEYYFYNVCPLKTYNISIRSLVTNNDNNKSELSSTTFSRLFQTGYNNIDCNSIKQFRENETLFISWTKPISLPDYYVFNFMNSSNNKTLIKQYNLTSQTNILSLSSLNMNSNSA
jgi:hypothetical protein